MRKEGKDHVLIPALIAAAAAYFGLKCKSEKLANIADGLVSKAIKDQTIENNKKSRNFRRKRRFRSGRRSRFNDSYYA